MSIDIGQREKLKELIVSGSQDQIQKLLDTNEYKRKKNFVKEIDHDNFEISFTLTQDSVDRDNERVLPKAFEGNTEYYLENPVVLYGHDHSIPAVGRLVDLLVQDDAVYGTVKYAVGKGHVLADLLWNLYSDETPFMRMGSIGFIPLKWSDNDKDKLSGQSGVTYQEIEPIEFSLVNIGANRFALSEVSMKDLPLKIRTDSVLKSAYQQLAEDDLSSFQETDKETGSQPKREHIEMQNKKEDELEKSSESTDKVTKEVKTDSDVFKTLAELCNGDITKVGQMLSVAMGNPTTSVDTEPTTLKTDDDIKLENLQKQAEIRKAEAEIAKAESEIAESKSRIRGFKKGSKSTDLSEYLNEQVGDGDDRDDIILQISEEADRSVATITGILEGTVECPEDDMVLEAFSTVLSIDEDALSEYTDIEVSEDDEDDEPEVDEEDEPEEDEVDEDDDEPEEPEIEVDENDDDVENIVMNTANITAIATKAGEGDVLSIRKLYGISGMFDGSFEEVKSLINDKISGYLEYELDLQDEYWIDYDILCTKVNEVVIYSYDKKQAYKIDYTISGKDVDFTNIEPVKLTYEQIEDMTEEGKTVSVNRLGIVLPEQKEIIDEAAD